MKKTPSQPTPLNKKPKSSSFFQLVPKAPLAAIVPVVTGQHSKPFHAALNDITNASNPKSTVHTTPEGKHIKTDENGVCGTTASGSKLVFHSPAKHLEITIDTSDSESEKVDLYLLTREKDYVAKQRTQVFVELEKSTVSLPKTLSVTASHETREDQQPRKKARKESVAVGCSAKQIVFDYFKKCGVDIPEAEVEKEKWNLCHLLSYAIAMNGVAGNGKTFDTQIRENIFSGSRVLNENMMRIENALLQMIKDDAVDEINYMALHSEFENSHVLAKLTLEVRIKRGGSTIAFNYPFDVSDDRRVSPEASTAYYALIRTLIDNLENAPEPDDGIAKTLRY